MSNGVGAGRIVTARSSNYESDFLVIRVSSLDRVVVPSNMEAAVCGDSKDAEAKDRGSRVKTAIRRQVSSTFWVLRRNSRVSVVQYQQLSPNNRLQGLNKHPSESHAES